jgi:ABC-type Fe3+-hydroxamate transport system substrate-binding protein
LCKKDEFKVSQEVNKILKEEEELGINRLSTYKKFAESLYQIKNNVKKNLKNLLKENKKIYGYGAPAKASTAINFFQISEFIEKIIEDNSLKHSKYIPGTEIEVIKKEDIKNIKPEFIIVFAWNFFQEIKNNNKLLSNVFINIKDLER